MKSRVIYSFLLLINLGLAAEIGAKVYSFLQVEVGVFVIHPINYDPSPKFVALAHGCGGANDHWGTAFISRDGIKVSMTGETYPTNIQARRELHKQLRGAIRILEKK